MTGCSILQENMVGAHINSFSLSISSEGRVEVVGGGSLQISNLTEEDAGVYTCTADSGNGTIEAQARLSVQGTLGLRAEELTMGSGIKKNASLVTNVLYLNMLGDVDVKTWAALSHSLTSRRYK